MKKKESTGHLSNHKGLGWLRKPLVDD
uniref:Uncharacterized protein n=1 Tax=Anguilla anguilla TaxID=7936 RepID=A0A0E9Q8P2_ANGAN